MPPYPTCDEGYRIAKVTGCSPELMGSRMLELRTLERMMIQAVKDGEAAKDSHEFWRILTIATGIAGAASDVVIATFASPLAGAGYDQAKTMAKALNADFAPADAYKKIADTHVLVTNEVLKSQGKQAAGRMLSTLWLLGGVVKDLANLEASTRKSHGSGIDAGIATAKRSLRQLRAKMSDLRAAADSCTGTQTLHI